MALEPHAVVARVCRVEQDAERRAPARTQVRIAIFGAEQGAPLVRVRADVDPGPHEIDGWIVTLWDRVVDPRPVAPGDVGRTLRELHRSLEPYAGALASYDPRPLAVAVADALPPGDHEAADLLRRAAAAYAPPLLPTQPLHGDAYVGNVMRTPDGPRWIDLEDACSGPVEWDLACLAHRTAMSGEVADQTRAVLAGYGPDAAERAELMTDGVALYIAARTARAYVTRPELGTLLRGRLDFVRARLCT